MLTIKPTPDYDAILRWNAGKDEAFLFQWAGTTAYCHPLTKEQLMRQSAKDGVTVFMAYERFPSARWSFAISTLSKKRGASAAYCSLRRREEGDLHTGHFLPFAKRSLPKRSWSGSPCGYSALISLLSDVMKKWGFVWQNILKKKTLTGTIIPWS